MASSSPTTTKQPQAAPDPSLVEAAHPISPIKRKPSACRRITMFIHYTFLAISIGLLYGVPTAMVFAVFFILALGFTLGLVAANGAVVMLIGNGILRAAHLAHYTDNASAAAIGATGGIIASLIVGIFTQCKDENGKTPWYISLGACIIASTLTGTIGCAILLHNHVDLGPIDVLHATRAGALGGAIFGPGMILAVPLLFTVLFIALSPLWLAMMAGLQWAYTQSSESWDGRTYKYSTCYSYGTCGNDPEINEEIEAIERRERRRNTQLLAGVK